MEDSGPPLLAGTTRLTSPQANTVVAAANGKTEQK